MKRNLISMLVIVAMVALSACGKSSSDNTPASTSTPTPTPAATTVLSGLASKGPINDGTVKVFAVKNGVVDTSAALATGQTDSKGNFAVDAGNFTGSVVVEVTGGSFTDEVSGATVQLKTKLRAMVSSASTGTKTVAVTPLTELASKKAELAGGLTTAAIDDANKKMSSTFGVDDIISTLPKSAGTEAEKKHAAACGSFSQLANDHKGKHSGESLDDALTNVMGEMETEMESNDGQLDVTGINQAITEFNDGGHNGTGVTASMIAASGGVLKISTSGAAANIDALDMTVNLPAGMTVAADPATGEAAASAVAISGVAATGSNKLIATKVSPTVGGSQLTISMVNAGGFGAGECVTINFTMASGAPFPASASAVTVTGVAAKDANAAPIAGVTAAPAALTANL